jgi:hypothetical protein
VTIKSRIIGIILALGVGFGSLLSMAPTALADSSGGPQCNRSTLGCVILIVNLSPAPPTGATVHAHREAPIGTDDNFNLSAVNAGQYTSGAAGIYDSNP